MNRKTLASLTIAAMFAASAAVLASVTINPDGSAFVGKGDVLSLYFTGPHAEDNFEANASGVSFYETLSQTVEQDCYTNGQHQTFVGVRTGQVEAEASVVYSARKNSQNKITGFQLDAPDPASIDWSDLEWNHPAGTDNQGCPLDVNEQDQHPKFPPRFGPIQLTGLWVSYGGVANQIYP